MAMAAAAVLMLILSGCAAPWQMQKPAGKPLVLAIDQWPPEWYVDIASEKGYFARENVSVQIIKTGTDNGAIDLFQANRSIDCIVMAPTDLFHLRENGVMAKAIFPTDGSIGSDVLVSNPNITSISQLRGKRVGYDEFDSYGHIFVAMLLAKYNLSESDAQMQVIAAEDVPAAIKDGQLDAGYTYEPAKFEALADGDRELGNSTELPPMIFDFMACRQKTIDERPGDVQKFVDAWFTAKEFEKESPGGARDMMALANHMPVDDIESYYAGNHFYGLDDGREAFFATNPEGIVSAINITGKFVLVRGEASGGADPEELVDGSFLQNAEPGLP